MRRQLWLQRNQAVQVVNAYAEAMQASRRGAQPQHNGTMPERPRRKEKPSIMSMTDFLAKEGLH